MRIWIDLTNSPHVNFFAPMIEDLSKEHDVILTARPLANTIELLKLYKFQYNIIGRHYGKGILKKTVGYIVRIWQLFTFLRKKYIDVAISHSSFYSPIVAKMLKAKCIYLNDNEHAEGNRLSFIFADKIMIPEFLDTKEIQKQWAKREKIIKYPGVKEGVYLWHYKLDSLNDLRFNKVNDKKVIFYRPEPWTAQYYKGSKNFTDELLLQLVDLHEVFVLPRDKKQIKYYKQNKFVKIKVLENTVNLVDIMKNCDLFIGAGGTMTRESAVLGVPTISIYQDQLLQVDKFLIEKGFMAYSKNPDLKFITDFLKKTEKGLPNQSLIDKGKQAYYMIKNTLLSLSVEHIKHRKGD